MASGVVCAEFYLGRDNERRLDSLFDNSFSVGVADWDGAGTSAYLLLAFRNAIITRTSPAKGSVGRAGITVYAGTARCGDDYGSR